MSEDVTLFTVGGRLKLLRSVASEEGITLPDDVSTYIAGRYSKMRDLEGALIRVIAYAVLTGSDMSMELAQGVLDRQAQYDEE